MKNIIQQTLSNLKQNQQYNLSKVGRLMGDRYILFHLTSLVL
jgi:hypothetical protein